MNMVRTGSAESPPCRREGASIDACSSLSGRDTSSRSIRRPCYDSIMHGSPSTADTAQVTLTLPRAVVRSAEQVAARTHRPVETVLAEWLDQAAAELPVEALEDADLLA